MSDFVIRFTNVICSTDGSRFPTADEAIAAGKRAGFEFTVWYGDDQFIVASWTVFGGLRKHGPR